jgi:hypothetical protein
LHSDTGVQQVFGSTSGPDSNQAWAGTHNTATATTGITVANESVGSGSSFSILNPYYALAFIQKS